MEPSRLQSSEQSSLFDEIDCLRTQGINHYISLPQLIVTGDQSSGKSSVLEAISGIAFPTKDNLCTRFATEVILRKHSSESIKISIISSNKPGSIKLKTSQHHVKDLGELPALIERAKETMNLDSTQNAFSDDVLRVEVCGPKQPHLTIVDLPGLIHSENKQQSASDVALVSTMVKWYMANPRSIILAIVSAKNDHANQIILKLAKEVDPAGHRTVGVITKPDTLSFGSESEKSYVELANNKDVVFHLGWHVLRNRSYEDRARSSADRDVQEEAFFGNGIWKDLSRDIVGITSLRTRLSKILFSHIKTELPALVKEIEDGLEDCRQRLTKMSSARSTVHEQRLHILNICQQFQILTRAAIDGTYDHPFFEDPTSATGKSRRLRAMIQNLNIIFADEIHVLGARWKIHERAGMEIRKTDIGPDDGNIFRPQMESRVIEILRQSRGRELPGLVNPAVVGTLFQEQAAPWQTIVR